MPKTRKKNRGRPRPQSPPPSAQFAELERRLTAPRLLTLCVLAMLACYAAVFGGVSDGEVVPGHWMNYDGAYPYHIFKDAVDPDASLSSRSRPFSDLWFPENFLFQWPLFAVGASWVFTQYALVLLQALMGAAGWMLVCARLGGGWAARCAALPAWAAPLLALSYGGDVFMAQAHGYIHLGAWLCSPWLLWLALPHPAAKDDSPPDTGRWAGMAALLAVLVASEPLALPWFVAPAAAAAAFMLLRRRWNFRKTALFFAALALGVAGGIALSELTPMTARADGNLSGHAALRLDLIELHARMVGRFLLRLASENPILALIWLAFAARATLCFFRAWTAKRGEPAGGVFVAAYLPAAMLAPVLAVIVTARFPGPLHGNGEWVWLTFRYFIPTILLPLFAGWTVPPISGVFARLSLPPRVAVGALALALTAAAAPKIAVIAPEKLSPFATPFHQCVTRAATERGWSRGAGSPFIMSELDVNPHNGVDKSIFIANWRRAAEDPLRIWWINSNRDWYAGEFDFVVFNRFTDERLFDWPPTSAEDAGCLPHCAADMIYGLEDVRRTFGEPNEVVECGSMGLAGYNPPLRVDMSELSNEELSAGPIPNLLPRGE